jgi:hypothetical protein
VKRLTARLLGNFRVGMLAKGTRDNVNALLGATKDQ